MGCYVIFIDVPTSSVHHWPVIIISAIWTPVEIIATVPSPGELRRVNGLVCRLVCQAIRWMDGHGVSNGLLCIEVNPAIRIAL